MARRKKQPQTQRKKKQQQRPRARRARRPRLTASGGSIGHHQLTEQVCSVYDAFCPGAKGAKLFDQNTARSCTYQSRVVRQVTTDATGMAFVWVTPDPQLCVNYGTLAAGTVTAWTSADVGPYYTLVNTGLAQNMRIVSFGVKFMTTQAWTAATGVMTVVDTPTNFATAVVGQTTTSTGMGVTKIVPVRDALVTFVSGTRGNENLNYSSNVGSADWAMNQFILTIVGATVSSTIGFVEVVINYEWLPSAASGYADFASPAAPHIQPVMDARSRVATVGESIRSAGVAAGHVNGFLQDAGKALTEVASVAATVSSIASGPAGGLARMGMRALMM